MSKKPKYGDKVTVILSSREDGLLAQMPLQPNVVQSTVPVITSEVPAEVIWNGFCRRRHERGEFIIVEGGTVIVDADAKRVRGNK